MSHGRSPRHATGVLPKAVLLGLALFTVFSQGLWSIALRADVPALVDPFVMLALLVIPRPRRVRGINKLARPLAVFWILWEALGIFAAINPSIAVGDVLVSIRSLLIFFVLTRLPSLELVLFYRNALILTAFLQSLIAIAQWRFGIGPLPFFGGSRESYRSFGTMPVSHSLAIYLVVVCHATLGALFSQRKGYGVFLTALGAGVLALFTTYNRAGWLALVLTIPLIVIWACRVHHFTIRRGRRVFIPLAIVFGVLFTAKYGQVVVDRFFFMVEDSLVGDAPQSRLNLMRDGLRIVQERPLFGTSKANYRAYADPRIPGGLPYVHNSLVFIAAETGIPCFLACLGLLLAAGLSARQALRQHGTDIRLRAAIAASTTGILAYLISTFSTPDYHIPQIRYLFWGWLGLHFSLCALRVSAPSRDRGAGPGPSQRLAASPRVAGNWREPESGNE
ncbi:MAG: O-antigen ligase family protein [Planctomycetota bacterium]